MIWHYTGVLRNPLSGAEIVGKNFIMFDYFKINCVALYVIFSLISYQLYVNLHLHEEKRYR